MHFEVPNIKDRFRLYRNTATNLDSIMLSKYNKIRKHELNRPEYRTYKHTQRELFLTNHFVI